MSFAFPETKEDFVAPNGVTYTWEENRWRTKSYELNDSKLENYLPLSGGNLTGTLKTNSLIKSTRSTGKAFEVKPNDRETTGAWENSGNLSIYSTTTNSGNYVFSVRAKGYELEGYENPTAFRVTAGGSIKAGHDNSTPFMAETANDVLTMAYGLDNYLPKSNPNVHGKITVTPTDWMEQSQFRNLENDGSYFILKPSTTTSNCEVQYFGMQTDDWHIATLKYVQDYVSNHLGDAPIGGEGNYLPLTGGTLAGNLEMFGGYIKCLNGNPVSWFDQSGNWAAEFKGKGEKTFQMVSAEGVSIEWNGRSTNGVSMPGVKFDPRLMQWEFTNVKDPVADTDVASKRYVDAQVVAANKSWAPSLFKFTTENNISLLTPQTFFINDSDNLCIDGRLFNGKFWWLLKPNENYTHTMDNSFLVSISDPETGESVFQAKVQELVFHNMPNNQYHVSVKTTYPKKKTLTADKDYLIDLPGFLPRFVFS